MITEQLYSLNNWLNNIPDFWWWFLFTLVKIGAAIGIGLGMVAYAVVLERRVASFIQDRLGPNRAGPWGLLQPVCDGLKSFLKEDFIPAGVHKFYYWIAPVIILGPALMTIAVIPFGSKIGNQSMVISDLNVGLLYTFAVASISVYGILLAGYAANSKYPIIGGMRAGAQMISYEGTMGLSIIPIFMLAGSTNLNAIIAWQTSAPLHWGIIQAPLSALLFFIATLAEANRVPFDLPEAEQELAGGYNTEYGAMKFAMFFMAEYASVIMGSAIFVTLFLGGWSLPLPWLNSPASNTWMGMLIGIIHICIFLAKTIMIVFLIVWIRWMLPRFRFDQLMDLGWRKLMPLALANIAFYALLLWAIAIIPTFFQN